MKKLIAAFTALAVASSLSSCGGGGGRGGGGGADPVNRAPVANAGPDQTVTAGSTVTLDGSGSQDLDGDALTYRWTLDTVPGGSQATLSSSSIASPVFTADKEGTYVASLVVSDGIYSSSADTVSVIAEQVNVAPVADAGPDQSVLVGATVSLDGSRSSDANGDTLTYEWRLSAVPVGSTASLSDNTAVRPTFAADQTGNYTATLTVSDGRLTSQPDQVVVSVAAQNAAPVANAGPDQEIAAGSTVTLDGSASTDADGDVLRYAWSIASRPPGSQASLDNPGAARPRFVADVAGDYSIRLVVNDGRLDSAADEVVVTAVVSNAAPTANAGPDQSVATASVVTLDGSGSSDPDGDPISFRWSLTSVPAGSSAKLSDPQQINPTFTADVDGDYIASLIVSDGSADSAADTVIVSAAAVNAAPVADAGADQTVYQGDRVVLDGSGSSDPDGDPITYAWSFVSYPGVREPILSGSTGVAPSFSVRDPGDYVLRLTVSDGSLTSTPDTVLVRVQQGVGPTPPGTGLVVGHYDNTWVLDEQTMTRYVDFVCDSGFSSFDQGPDGVLLGTKSDAYLYEVNAAAGICVRLGTTPEWIIRVAVSQSGQIYGVSSNQYDSGTGLQARRLYKLSSSGASQSFVYFSGAARYVDGIDFGPEGVLYGIGIVSGSRSLVEIDPETGVTRLVTKLITPPSGDIDIDGSGLMRGVIDDSLIKYDLVTQTVLSTTLIPEYQPGAAPLSPIAYVP